MAKKHFFGQKFLWQAKKKILVRNAKIAWKSHWDTTLGMFFSNFWIGQYFWKFQPKKSKTMILCQKKHFLALFGQNFLKFEKTFPREVS